MDVVVFGAGSLGSLLGGLLARRHAVTLVGRDPHVTRVRERGLRVTGAREATVRPDATTAPPDDAAFDLALVAVKSFDTDAAATALGAVNLGAALSVQNGLGNEARLARALDGVETLAGTCTYGARLVDPGVVECTGVGEVALGPRGGGESATADRVGRALSEAGVEATVAADMPRRLWEKLAVNAGVNATTALARVDNGALREDPAGDVARAAARETARVARAEGIDLSVDAAAAALDRVAAATAGNVSSMRQDVRAGRRTEVDAINGAVVERAPPSVAVPVNRTLAGLVTAWERGNVGDENGSRGG